MTHARAYDLVVRRLAPLVLLCTSRALVNGHVMREGIVFSVEHL